MGRRTSEKVSIILKNYFWERILGFVFAPAALMTRGMAGGEALFLSFSLQKNLKIAIHFFGSLHFDLFSGICLTLRRFFRRQVATDDEAALGLQTVLTT